jgi:hypothetical protein
MSHVPAIGHWRLNLHHGVAVGAASAFGIGCMIVSSDSANALPTVSPG